MKPGILFAAGLCCIRTVAMSAQHPDSTPVAAPAATVTGYITTSYTTATHGATPLTGRLFGRQNNDFMFNVAEVTIDRAAATDRWDAGVHVEPVVGQNAATAKSGGLDLGPHADLWQAYGTLNIPVSKDRYWQIKAGKMATLMGLEVLQDMQNPNLDAGSQDIFLEPFTETGIELDGKFSTAVDAELRITNGWDLVTDNNRAKSVVGRVGLAPGAGTTVALLGYAGPEQAGNTSNLRRGAQALISRTVGGGVTTWLQLDYGEEDGAATDGATAKWSAAGFWMTADIASHVGLAVRADLVNDHDGARLSGAFGYPVNTGQTVTSVTATLNIRRWSHALVRPELRYDHSTLPVYAGRHSALTLALGWSVLW